MLDILFTSTKDSHYVSPTSILYVQFATVRLLLTPRVRHRATVHRSFDCLSKGNSRQRGHLPAAADNRVKPRSLHLTPARHTHTAHTHQQNTWHREHVSQRRRRMVVISHYTATLILLSGSILTACAWPRFSYMISGKYIPGQGCPNTDSLLQTHTFTHTWCM